MLSKFEHGKNELSAQKLFIALDNTHTEVNEFLYLVRGFSESRLTRFQKTIQDLELHHDFQGLKTMYDEEK